MRTTPTIDDDLLTALRERARRTRHGFKACLSGTRPVAMPWAASLGFVRIMG